MLCWSYWSVQNCFKTDRKIQTLVLAITVGNSCKFYCINNNKRIVSLNYLFHLSLNKMLFYVVICCWTKEEKRSHINENLKIKKNLLFHLKMPQVQFFVRMILCSHIHKSQQGCNNIRYKNSFHVHHQLKLLYSSFTNARYVCLMEYYVFMTTVVYVYACIMYL